MNISAEAERFLQEPNLATLATVGPRGEAHATPVWYLYEGGEFVVMVDQGSRKHLNVASNPRAAVSVHRTQRPYVAVMARGVARIEPGVPQPLVLRIATRYLGEMEGKAYAESVSGNPMLTIRLRPRRLIEYPAPTPKA